MSLKQELDKFVKKWDGIGIDYDHYYGNQCMDLMRLYLVEVLEFSDTYLKAYRAKDVFLKFDTMFGRSKFTKIVNTREAIPIAGDIMFWSNDDYGHVAVFVEGDVQMFKSFDQNYPLHTVSHLQDHSYVNVLGWLRPKVDFSDSEVTNSEPNMNKDEQNAMLILKKFKSENKKLKGGNLEGAVNAMVGWANDMEKLDEVKENLKNSLKLNIALSSKVTELEKSGLFCQAKVKTANGKTRKVEELANNNIKLYKNKNDEFNAVKFMTTRWLHLIKFCTLKFKGMENEEYLKEELPKVVKSLNKEA